MTSFYRRKAQRSVLFVVLIGACTLPGRAQGSPDPLAWSLNTSANTFDLYDRNGIIAQQHALPTPLPLSFKFSKGPNGLLWVSDSLIGQLYAFGPTGHLGTLSFPGIHQAAPTSVGTVWILSAPAVFGNGLLKKIDTTAATLVSVSLPTASFQITALINDPFDNAWIVDLGSTFKYDSSGTLVTAAVTLANTQQAVCDGEGRLWFHNGQFIHAIDNNGIPIATIPMPGVRDLSIDARGGVRALVTSPTQMLHTLDPTTLSPIASLPISLPTGAALLRVSFDATGQMWCEDSNGILWLLDAGANTFFQVLGGTLGQINVIATGANIAAVLLPNADSDGDGVENQQEVQLGSDCFDSTSQPLSFGISAAPVAGQSLSVGLFAPAQAGFLYFSGASSAAAWPGFSLSAFHPHAVPLLFDPLLVLWLSPSNLLTPQGNSGTLDANGFGMFPLNIPPGSSGLSFSLAALTLDPLTLTPRSLSLPLNLTIL